MGQTVLAQSAESLRKIRNSARFILGNIGDVESRKDLERVDVRDMSIVCAVIYQTSHATCLILLPSGRQACFARTATIGRTCIHQLHSTQLPARSARTPFLFILQLISFIAAQAISRFANVTLSAFYFDIAKDILYADSVESVQRRAVVTVLEKVSRHI